VIKEKRLNALSVYKTQLEEEAQSKSFLKPDHSIDQLLYD
jgi:hypothetical protein